MTEVLPSSPKILCFNDMCHLVFGFRENCIRQLISENPKEYKLVERGKMLEIAGAGLYIKINEETRIANISVSNHYVQTHAHIFKKAFNL